MKKHIRSEIGGSPEGKSWTLCGVEVFDRKIADDPTEATCTNCVRVVTK